MIEKVEKSGKAKDEMAGRNAKFFIEQKMADDKDEVYY